MYKMIGPIQIQNNKLLSYHLGETCFEELEQSQKTNYWAYHLGQISFVELKPEAVQNQPVLRWSGHSFPAVLQKDLKIINLFSPNFEQ